MSRTRNRPSQSSDTDRAVEEARSVTRELDGPTDLDALVDRVSDARCVLIGEASHGTSEFYRWRSWLTAQLIREHDFSFVAVEGDWTDCYDLNRRVKGLTETTTREVLETFGRWPTWMWANWEVAAFIDWLASYNEGHEMSEMAGFYGLDVYNLFESMEALVEYLEGVDPDAAADAREAYRCFEPYDEGREYARAMRMAPESCEDEAVEVLSNLVGDGPDYGDDHPDERFSAEQNALVAKNAEAYYRSMIGPDDDSWNVRDTHMIETFDRLLDHHDPDAKGIVWAHNTHVGDARATTMADRGRINIGQLARERHDDTAIVGFGSHHGSVIAGEEWGAPMGEMRVPTAQPDSLEDAFHRAGQRDRLLLAENLDDSSALADERGHRAIGVVYDPDREAGNYVPTVLPERYDAFVHVDETTALHPLETYADREAVPELYPSGL